MNKFFASTFENWQSEWAQLFVQALLIQALGHVLYRKEMEDQERMEGKLDELLTRSRQAPKT
jgi:low affinity Fe/Cu permease